MEAEADGWAISSTLLWQNVEGFLQLENVDGNLGKEQKFYPGLPAESHGDFVEFEDYKLSAVLENRPRIHDFY